jgi:hypothetical protein
MRIEGDFKDEAAREAFAQRVCDVLNELAEERRQKHCDAAPPPP